MENERKIYFSVLDTTWNFKLYFRDECYGSQNDHKIIIIIFKTLLNIQEIKHIKIIKIL